MASPINLKGVLLTDEEIAANCRALAGRDEVFAALHKIGVPVDRQTIAAVQGREEFHALIQQFYDQYIAPTFTQTHVRGLEQTVDERGPIFISAHHSHSLDSTVFNRHRHARKLSIAMSGVGVNLREPEVGYLVFSCIGTYPVGRENQAIQLMRQTYPIMHAIRRLGIPNWISNRPGLVQMGNNETHQNIVRLIQITSEYKTIEELSQHVDIHGIANNYGIYPGWQLRAHRVLAGERPPGYDTAMIIASLREPKETNVQIVGPPVRAKTLEEFCAQLNCTIQGEHLIFPEDFLAYAREQGEDALAAGKAYGFTSDMLRRVDEETARVRKTSENIAHTETALRAGQVDNWLTYNSKPGVKPLELVAQAAFTHTK